MKLLAVTWSYEDLLDISNSFLYKSFLKHNAQENFIHIHFNRNNYADLETEYSNRFGYQYEFLLYRIFLLQKRLEGINSDYLIIADTSDVVVLDNINIIPEQKNKIIFSCEKHQYPRDTIWLKQKNYSQDNITNGQFLNGGVLYSHKDVFNNLLLQCIEKIFPTNYRDFGGDQGIFSYFYINLNEQNIIDLDKQCEYFLSTYLRTPHDYRFENNRIVCNTNNTRPIFIHDNGWNYGSPKFIERFNLL